MTLNSLASRIGKLVADNSPVILTAIGVSGVLTTACLTAKASFKAAEILREAAFDKLQSTDSQEKDYYSLYEVLTAREKAELTWKLYIPATASAALTIAVIVCENRIGTRRAAMMAAAYSTLGNTFDKYQEKIVEVLGKNKEQKVRDTIAQDRVNESKEIQALPNQQIVVAGPGQQLFFDAYTGRPFYSDMESMRKAENDINFEVNNNNYASLTDFYYKIGLSPVTDSSEVGWNINKLLKLEYSTTLTDDNRSCIVVDFRVRPIRDYYRIH